MSNVLASFPVIDEELLNKLHIETVFMEFFYNLRR